MPAHILSKMRPTHGATQHVWKRLEERFPRTSPLRHLSARELGVVVALAAVGKVGGEEK